MRKLLTACLLAASLPCAALAFAAAAPSTAPTQGTDSTPAPEWRIPINGCTVTVQCPRGTSPSSVTCIGHSPNGCVSGQGGNPPWVACDGVVHSCSSIIP